MTQVINNSPQITALVAGEAAAHEQIKRQNQIEESRRLQEQQRSRVLSAEQSTRSGDPLEDRTKPVTDREARKQRRATPSRPEPEPVTTSASTSFFQVQAVIDRCV
jgi:hypothetical protein